MALHINVILHRMGVDDADIQSDIRTQHAAKRMELTAAACLNAGP